MRPFPSWAEYSSETSAFGQLVGRVVRSQDRLSDSDILLKVEQSDPQCLASLKVVQEAFICLRGSVWVRLCEVDQIGAVR